MSRTNSIRPTGAAALVISVIGMSALGTVSAGCSAGQVTQTSSQVSAVGGAAARTSGVVVRDAQIEYGSQVEGAAVYRRGGSAPLSMSIVNTGGGPDRLVSATTVWADAVQITGDTEVPGGSVLLVGGRPAAPAPTGPAPAAPAPPPAPTSAPTATPVPTAAPSDQRVAQIVLTGLRDDIRAGLTYEVVLTFERAGEIHLALPVANPTTPRRDRLPPQ